MNKKLRILLLTGLAALFCSSCSKMEEILPESYKRNDLPFSVEKVPVEGGTITLQKVVGESVVNIDPASATQTFSVGDTLILTATAKNGYTFINWKRDGVEKSIQPEYKFCLEGKDVDENGRVKYHYEARFGLDYALQVIPPIDKVIPHELIVAMGSYLHFGDNPRKIDSSFIVDHVRLARFIQHDPTTTYFKQDSTYTNDQHLTFKLSGQHRCMAESALFVHHWGEIYEGSGIFFYEDSKANDSIFIMGDGDWFTVYYHHLAKKRMEPDEQYAHMISDFQVERKESFILSGRLTSQGIAECRIGTCVESYSEASPRIGLYNGLPGIHDIIIYDFPNEILRYATTD